MSPRTFSGKAIASLFLATVSVGLWQVADVPARAAAVLGLVLAALALWDIRRGAGRLKGTPLAAAAVALGLGGMLLVPAVRGVREAVQRMDSA